MTIDFSDRNWKLKRSLSFTRFTSRMPKELGLPMKARLLRVEARFPNAKPTWIKAGSLHQIYRGSTPPDGQVIAFGQQLITMTNLTPYTLLFRPISWLPEGYLRVWEYLPSLTDRDLLSLSVQNDNSISSTITQLFTDIMSTDLRQQKISIAAVKAEAIAAQDTANNAMTIGQLAQQAADTVSTTVQTVIGTVETLSGEMVRKFTSQSIEAAAFVFDPVRNYYYATVSHLLLDLAPDVEVYDTENGKPKDKQRIQSIIVDLNTIELELDADDLANNSFPLICIVLGKNAPV